MNFMMLSKKNVTPRDTDRLKKAFVAACEDAKGVAEVCKRHISGAHAAVVASARESEKTLQSIEQSGLLKRVSAWRKRAEMKRNPSVLVLEDDAVGAEMFAEDLKVFLGVEAHPASTFDQAVALLDAHDFSIALIDINLRDALGRTGLDLVDHLRSSGHATKIVLISGSVEDLERLGKLADAAATLQKPFGTSDMIRTVAVLTRKE